MNREPLITAATITAAVTAVITLLVAFGVPLTPEQQTAILGVVAVAGPLVVGIVARSKVAAWATVAAQTDATGITRAGPAAAQPTGAPVEVQG